MQHPRRIPIVIPDPALPGGASSPFSKELLRSLLRKQRSVLSVVLTSLEREFGQSVGVVSHLFCVWKVLAERKISPALFVVQVCCWWLNLHRGRKIRAAHICRLTGLHRNTVDIYLHKLLAAGSVDKLPGLRGFVLTEAGNMRTNELFRAVYSAVLDLYDEGQQKTPSR